MPGRAQSPDTDSILVPADLVRADGAEPVAAVGRDQAAAQKVSTLFTTVGRSR